METVMLLSSSNPFPIPSTTWVVDKLAALQFIAGDHVVLPKLYTVEILVRLQKPLETGL
jgi:hypothetical protein